MEMNKMIIVTAATPYETAWIAGKLTRPRSFSLGRFIAQRGRIGAASAMIFHTGVGKTNAAHGATLLLERFSPALFLMIGCGGAYKRSGLHPGGLAIATEEIFGDEGVITPRGWRSMNYLKLPLLRHGRQTFFNRFVLDRKTVAGAKKILRGYPLKSGPFVTVSEVTGTAEKAEEMENRFGGICENMEGAPAAQLCKLYGVPFLEIRGISNIVTRRNRREWNLAAAVKISQQAAEKIIVRWTEKQ